jgi:hypothetical protein
MEHHMNLGIKKFTTLRCALRKSAVIGFSTMVVLTFAISAQAGSNLVLNGGFESTSNGNGEMGYNTNATDWTTSGYNFIYAPGTADTTGANGQYGNISLWGPGNGSSNGMPASSPNGGNIVAADGAFQVGAITQLITGLTPGASYSVSFWWGHHRAMASQLRKPGAVNHSAEQRQSRLHRLAVPDVHLHREWHQRSALLPGCRHSLWSTAV